MRHIRINTVRDAIFTSLFSDQRASVLEEFVRCGAQIYVLAGALRDAITSYYQGGDDTPRDFDIAVLGVSREGFDSLLSAFGAKNRHGGYVLRGPGAPNWDVWRLEETIGIRKTGTPCSLENVLRTFNLDCNAIALDVRTGLFLDGGAVEAIRRKQLGFVKRAIQHSETTFSAKALLLELRLKYAASDEVKRFIKAHFDQATLLHETEKVFPYFVALPPARGVPPGTAVSQV